jgi:peptidoglycan/LPS O-acetylase OafA/YrhL
MRNEEIRSLTGLRFLIALWVFVFHIQIRWPIFSGQFSAPIANLGAIGMTFFFILSGYILSYNYDRDFRITNFYKARFARVYPVYLVVAILSLPWLIHSLEPSGLIKRCVEVLFLIAVDMFLLQAWFPSTFSKWNNGGSWSISVEAFFYVLFPLISKFFRLRNKSFYILATSISYFLVILIGIAVWIYPTSGMSIAYSMPIFRLPAFVFGILTFHLIKQDIWRNQFPIKIVVCILTIIFILDLTLIGTYLPLYVTHDWIAIPFFSFLIIYLVEIKSLLSRVISSRILNLLGKSSYSFYSLQIIFIFLAISFHDKIILRFPIFESNRIFASFSLLLLISFSIFFYRVVEEPSRRYFKSTKS